jgi:hypothetical protein
VTNMRGFQRQPIGFNPFILNEYPIFPSDPYTRSRPLASDRDDTDCCKPILKPGWLRSLGL